MTGFDLLETIRKHWAKGGTASYPVIFRDAETGNVYEATGSVRTHDLNKITVVEIRLRDGS